MSDNVQQTGSQASNGTSNGSTGSSESSGAGKSSAARPSMATLYFALRAEAVGSTDADVAHDLTVADTWYARYGSSADARAASKEGVIRTSEGKKVAATRLHKAVVDLQLGLRRVPGGAAFETSCEGKNDQSFAANVRAKITPGMRAGAIGPLVDGMLSELEKFEAASGEGAKARAACAQAVRNARVAKRMLALSIQSLRGALDRADAAKKMADLAPPTGSVKAVA